MTSASHASAPQLGRRAALALAAIGGGLAIGWRYGASGSLLLECALALVLPLSAVVLCADVLRHGAERKLWLVPVNIGLPLLLMVSQPHARAPGFAAAALWVLVLLAALTRRRTATLWCTALCGFAMSLSALSQLLPRLTH